MKHTEVSTLLADAAKIIDEAYESIRAKSVQLTQYFADKTVPLDDRWADFTTATDITGLLPKHPWTKHFSEAFGPRARIDLHMDFDRYTTIVYTDLYGELKDMLADGGSGVNSLDLSEETLDAWRELVLAAGCRAFTYDW